MSFEAELVARYADIRARLYGGVPAVRRAVADDREFQGPPCLRLLPDDDGGWRTYVNRVTLKTGLTYRDMCSVSKENHLCVARFEAFYLISRYVVDAHGNKLTWIKIGRIFKRTHATVRHGVRKWMEINQMDGDI